MSALLLFNKPYQVLCQFTDEQNRDTLANYIKKPGFYAAGRLDRDSEGLLLLTNDGKIQHRISHPKFKMRKQYLAQVEGSVTREALEKLLQGVTLKDGESRALTAVESKEPATLWPRNPPIRTRQSIPTSWITLEIDEGRNRQVRRMTAAVGLPTLRLIRTKIAEYDVWPLKPGELLEIENHIAQSQFKI